MTKVLLDTHALYWASEDLDRLSSTAADAITSAEVVYVSIASCWELAIKVALGHFDLRVPLEALLGEQLSQGVTLMPIALPHTIRVSTLPMHHRDPFDRMLAAQALVEKLPLISKDEVLDAYGVTRVW